MAELFFRCRLYVGVDLSSGISWVLFALNFIGCSRGDIAGFRRICGSSLSYQRI